MPVPLSKTAAAQYALCAWILGSIFVYLYIDENVGTLSGLVGIMLLLSVTVGTYLRHFFKLFHRKTKSWTGKEPIILCWDDVGVWFDGEKIKRNGYIG